MSEPQQNYIKIEQYMELQAQVTRLTEERDAARQAIEVWQREAGSAQAREDELREQLRASNKAGDDMLRDRDDWMSRHLEVSDLIGRLHGYADECLSHDPQLPLRNHRRALGKIREESATYLGEPTPEGGE